MCQELRHDPQPRIQGPDQRVSCLPHLELADSSRTTTPASDSPAELRTVPCTVFICACDGEVLCAQATSAKIPSRAPTAAIRAARNCFFIGLVAARALREKFAMRAVSILPTNLLTKVMPQRRLGRHSIRRHPPPQRPVRTGRIADRREPSCGSRLRTLHFLGRQA